MRYRDSAGKQFLLREYQNPRPLLVVFWASWCPACRQYLPRLLQVQRSGQAQVLLVNVGEDINTAQSYLRSAGLSELPSVYASERHPRGWNVRAFPQTVRITSGWQSAGVKYGALRENDPWLWGR